MIKEAKKNSLNKGCVFKYGDIAEFKFNKANLITSYYTIQFIHPSVRADLIKIFNLLTGVEDFSYLKKLEHLMQGIKI